MRNLFLFIFFIFSVGWAEKFEITVPPLKVPQIEIDGFGFLLEHKKPRIPTKSIWIMLPPKSKINDCKVERVFSSFINKLSIPKSFVMEEGVCASKKASYPPIVEEKIYPSIAGEYLGTQKWYGYEVAKISIFPISYNLETQETKYFSHITINIDYTPFGDFGEVDTIIDSIFYDNVLNIEQRERWYKEKPITKDEYVIVAPLELFSILYDFIEWKRGIGYKVKVITPEQIKEIGNPKYVLIIGEEIKLDGVFFGRIPYTESSLVQSILDRTIEFELNNKKKTVLFVKGVSNYKDENFCNIQYEDKSSLLNALKSFLPIDWVVEESINEVIGGDYLVINFLTHSKNWVWDNGNSVPDESEIRVNNYSLSSVSPVIVFSPFFGAKFLKEGAVCVVAPDSSSKYVIGWTKPNHGGNQSFNYWFLKSLIEKEKIGDAFWKAKFIYETYFPYDTLLFKIWGDPSLNLYGVPAVDIGITSIPERWIFPDTEFFPTCRIENFGRRMEVGCELCCKIDSSGKVIYANSIIVDTIKPEEIKIIKFSKWESYKPGIKYKVSFELFSVCDENPENDTLSIITHVIGGDFVVIGKDTTLKYELTNLGYKGIQEESDDSILQWIRNFRAVFISDKEIDSIPLGANIYVEGENLWLSWLLEGKKVPSSFTSPIVGKGFLFTITQEDSHEWFVPKDCTPIFTDSTGKIVGFCYEGEYKIWSTKFKLSHVPDSLRSSLIDTVMQFFGLSLANEEVVPKGDVGNIIKFESLPNPFSDKTFIRFKIKKYSCKVNLSVYNLAGNLVKELFNGFCGIGEYEIEWDSRDEDGKLVGNGVYFLRLRTETEKELIKLIIFR